METDMESPEQPAPMWRPAELDDFFRRTPGRPVNPVEWDDEESWASNDGQSLSDGAVTVNSEMDISSGPVSPNDQSLSDGAVTVDGEMDISSGPVSPSDPELDTSGPSHVNTRVTDLGSSLSLPPHTATSVQVPDRASSPPLPSNTTTRVQSPIHSPEPIPRGLNSAELAIMPAEPPDNAFERLNRTMRASENIPSPPDSSLIAQGETWGLNRADRKSFAVREAGEEHTKERMARVVAASEKLHKVIELQNTEPFFPPMPSAGPWVGRSRSCFKRKDRDGQDEGMMTNGVFGPFRQSSSLQADSSVVADGKDALGLREALLWHGKQPGANETRTELASLTFHDHTPNMLTGAWQNYLLMHYEAQPGYNDSNGEKLIMYEVDIPTTKDYSQPPKGMGFPPGYAPPAPRKKIVRWIWFYISRPLVSSSPNFVGPPAGPPNLPPSHKSPSHVVFAAPLANVICHPPVTETDVADPTYRHGASTVEPLVRRFRRHDFTFSRFGEPIFEFSQKDETLMKLMIHEVDECHRYAVHQGQENASETRKKILDMLDNFLEIWMHPWTGYQELLQTGHIDARSVSSWWRAAFYKAYENGAYWAQTKRAMSMGNCRVIARYREEPTSCENPEDKNMSMGRGQGGLLPVALDSPMSGTSNMMPAFGMEPMVPGRKKRSDSASTSAPSPTQSVFSSFSPCPGSANTTTSEAPGKDKQQPAGPSKGKEAATLFVRSSMTQMQGTESRMEDSKGISMSPFPKPHPSNRELETLGQNATGRARDIKRIDLTENPFMQIPPPSSDEYTAAPLGIRVENSDRVINGRVVKKVSQVDQEKKKEKRKSGLSQMERIGS